MDIPDPVQFISEFPAFGGREWVGGCRKVLCGQRGCSRGPSFGRRSVFVGSPSRLASGMDVDRPQGLGGPSVHGYRIHVSHVGPSSFAWSSDSYPGLSRLNASTGQKSEVKGQEARNLGLN